MTATKEKRQLSAGQKTYGLTSAQARRGLNLYGPNRIGTEKKSSAAKIFAGQFHDVMVIILLIATAVSVIIGEYADAVPIILIVVTNAILGFIQEFRAEKTLEKLFTSSRPLLFAKSSSISLISIP